MKKTIILLALLVIGTFDVLSQSDTTTDLSNPIYEPCSSFRKTPPLRDLLKLVEQVDDQTAFLNNTPKPYKQSRYNHELVSDKGIPSTAGIDPAWQQSSAIHPSTAFRTQVNVNGQNGGFPPDPTGAAGPNHYVQAVNNIYRVFTKEGVSITASANLNSIWDKTGSGDPIIMYDYYAQRWFISQFWGNPEEGTDNGIMIAISETSDPLGAYFTYEFSYTLFPDYPKFSVWPNAYYMTCNSSSADFSAFEREKMLIGDPTAGVLKMTFPDIPLFFNSIAPASADGLVAPTDYAPCYFFALQDDSFEGVDFDHIKVIKSTIDWEQPWTSNLTVQQEIPTEAFNSVFSSSWDDLTQKGTDQKLDAITGIFMNRAQYRRFDGYNVVMLCHTVDVDNTNRAGVRWYELRDADNGNWFIHQQSTYSPDNENNRWLGSISMDALGHIALGYCFTGPNHYPGIRYTGRFRDDPLNQMTVPELTAVEGLGPQVAGRRYGDYSHMSIDPENGHTFWFTGEYIGISGQRKTRIISFSAWHLSSLKEYELSPTLNAHQPYPGEINIIWSGFDNDQEVTFVLNDMNGKELAKQTFINSGEKTVNFNPVSKGIYVIRLVGKESTVNRKIYLAN